MRAVDLIREKRDGQALAPEAIRWLIEAYTAGQVGDDQLAAFAMAVFFKGMEPAELTALVQAMMASGEVLDLSELPGTKVDKHSTGGVGDKVSLCLAPLVAACGVPVPMISGRGLGHTGGTLDKLGSIPGFRVDASEAEFIRWLQQHGAALIGQTAAIVPADRKLYALRDVTATVESIPLISASIMSKKLAEGIDGLVLDVKVGSGAFMKTEARATELAQTMIGIGQGMGKAVRALITDMDRVLGVAVGNASEAWEAIEVLRGGGPEDLVELTVELGAEMLLLGGVSTDLDGGRAALRGAIDSGRGFERMEQIVAAQGGDPAALGARDRLPMPAERVELKSDRAGFLQPTDTQEIGRAAMLLGAGRARSADVIDPAVGLMVHKKPGDAVEAGEPLVTLEFNDPKRGQEAAALLQGLLSVGDTPPPRAPLIRARLGG